MQVKQIAYMVVFNAKEREVVFDGESLTIKGVTGAEALEIGEAIEAWSSSPPKERGTEVVGEAAVKARRAAIALVEELREAVQREKQATLDREAIGKAASEAAGVLLEPRAVTAEVGSEHVAKERCALYAPKEEELAPVEKTKEPARHLHVVDAPKEQPKSEPPLKRAERSEPPTITKPQRMVQAAKRSCPASLAEAKAAAFGQQVQYVYEKGARTVDDIVAAFRSDEWKDVYEASLSKLSGGLRDRVQNVCNVRRLELDKQDDSDDCDE